TVMGTIIASYIPMRTEIRNRFSPTQPFCLLWTPCLGLCLMAWPVSSQAATQIVAWGANYNHQRDFPTGLTNIVAVSAYGDNSLALRGTGIPVQWGLITNDPTWNVPASLTN